MIIIYDFDGTLTPYSLPQYELLEKCGYDEEKLMNRIKKELNNNKELYSVYYKCYMEILAENKIPMTKENICLGAKNVQFNNGVLEYFKSFQTSNTDIKHFIVTSGIQAYVDETHIRKFVDGVYGVTFNEENGIYKNIDKLVTDEKKVDAIKDIQLHNEGTNKIIYFGDGLKDELAFQYVHKIGGKNVFIASNNKSIENYNKLNINGIIDKCFEADFGKDTKLSEYIQKEIELEREC